MNKPDYVEKLEDLGFDVIHASDLEFLGFEISYRPEYGNWAISGVDRHKVDGEVLRMTLQVSDDPRDLAQVVIELWEGR